MPRPETVATLFRPRDGVRARSAGRAGRRRLAGPVDRGADRSFQKVAAAIRSAVSQGALQPGDALPSQRRLQQIYGVSKVTILEALRLLETEGLVRVRLGRTGGAVVLEPGRHSLARAIGLLVEMDRVDQGEVWELRRTVEVEAARLAAVRATPEHLARLDALLRALEARSDGPDAPPD